jgi:hypothetical protein
LELLKYCFVPKQRYLCHSDLTGQETGLGHIFCHRTEQLVIRCLCAQNNGHLQATVVHPQQWAALFRSYCCSSNHKNHDEVATADNSHWLIFGTDLYLLPVCKVGMNYCLNMLA